MNSKVKFPVSVLCVDDETTNLDILTRHLANSVETIYVAENGRDGFALFEQHQPDIIMTDLVMPAVDGLEMSRMIRSVDTKIPIILLTGCISIDSLVRAIDNGITHFLPKPILRDKLMTALQRCYDSIDLERRFTREHDRARLLSAAMEQSTTAVVLLDSAGTVVHVNLSSQLMYGWLPENMMGKNLLSFDISSGLRSLVEMALATTKPCSGEIEIIRTDSYVTSILATISPFGLSESGLNYFISLKDITEKKLADTHLLRVQKLESLGVLAGGVAHNFNNILTAIIGNAQLAMMKLQEDSPAVKFLSNIESAAVRAADIAKQMLDFSGKGAVMIALIDVDELLKNMQDILEVTVPGNVSICFTPGAGKALLKGDAAQLRQVVMNLIINAVEALDGHEGTIGLSTGCKVFNQDYLATCLSDEDIVEGKYVFFEISDTGCGMNKDTISKLFDPFFSTKFTGRGLGMAAVMGIVRWHKGAVQITSQPGEGSIFRILLPAISEGVTSLPGGANA